MAIRYANLISPIKVGNVVMKNRMTAAPSTPHYLQGSENFPTDKLIEHFAGRARNGAAAVTINHLTIDKMEIPGVPAADNPPMHFNMMDMYDAGCQNYLCRLVDEIHFYGGLALAYVPTPNIGVRPPEGDGPPPPPPGEAPMPGAMPFVDDGITVDNMTRQQMEDYIAEIVGHALVLKKLGFDMFSIHSAYRRTIHAQFLSPRLNHRTDEYGGSAKNRSRFTLELYKALRKALGAGTPLEIVMSVSEKDGWSVEDSITFAELAQGVIDIMHLRGGETDPQHPTGFTSTPDRQMPYLAEIARVSHSCRKKGIKMLIGASAGFHDPDLAEKALADGDCDLICMARSWICDPEYGKKIYEGRGEDVVPCIRCNKCHGVDAEGFRSFCSVNPVMGLEEKISRMTAPVERKKKVAVVGGGPAGMEAAIVCAERGHDVTLYESRDFLGGALTHADDVSFKWPIKHFKEYLIRRLETSGAKVELSCTATREMLDSFDAVIVAVGAKSKRPDIPGADGANVMTAPEAYEKPCGKCVVIIGGGETGVETGIHLAETGHEVTVLARSPRLAPKAAQSHYRSMLEGAWKAQPGFTGVCNARCTAIGADFVEYESGGATKRIPADTVVIASGMEPKTGDALALFGAVANTVMVGDCVKASQIQHAMRTAYAAAIQI